MENLLHILKLIKQTKCEKQAKLPSTLQSRYTYTNRGYTNKHTHTQTLTQVRKKTEQKNKLQRGTQHTHTYSLIYTVITSCGGQSAANRKMTNKKKSSAERARRSSNDDDENTHTHANRKLAWRERKEVSQPRHSERRTGWKRLDVGEGNWKWKREPIYALLTVANNRRRYDTEWGESSRWECVSEWTWERAMERFGWFPSFGVYTKWFEISWVVM